MRDASAAHRRGIAHVPRDHATTRPNRGASAPPQLQFAA